MNIEKLLFDLLERGMTLWATGDNLGYKAPEGVLTAELRTQIVAHKQEILAQLGQNQPHAICSFAQQRLWFLYQWNPESSAYSMPLAVRLRGALDVAALQRGMDEILRRHGALRTTFKTLDGQPVQVIAPTKSVALQVVELADAAADKGEALARRRVGEEIGRPFDLENGPLVRVHLLCLAAEDHVLLVNMHHIISDGWSIGVLIRELSVFYRAFVKGAGSPLPDLPRQYADFAIEQRLSLQGARLEAQLGYWRKQLTPEPPVLELPTAGARPPVQTYRGAEHAFEISAQVTAGLQELSRAENTTLFMTMLAAFKVLLYRYCGQSDFAVGMPIANRNRREIEEVIGFFVNTLVLRSDLSGNPSFREFLGRVRQTALDAYAHQDLPFEMLVEDLQPRRDPSHTPLFQVMFTLKDDAPELDFPGLVLEPLGSSSAAAKFDMVLSIAPTSTGITVNIDYNVDLFSAATIARIAAHFDTLIAGLLADPDAHIAQLPLLDAAELERQLRTWNATEKPAPTIESAPARYAALAAQQPDALALVCGEERLSYAELERRANQLAHYLRQQGVGPESYVALYLTRSADFVVAALATWKAGGAYVPIDPAYPQGRVAWILSDTQSPVILTQAALREQLPECAGHVVCMDTEAGAFASQPESAPEVELYAQSVAYVIYTSGSTGRPKGVQIGQRSLLNLVSWSRRAFELTAADRLAQVAGLGFDAAVWEVWQALLNGTSLHFVPEELRSQPRLLRDWLLEQEISGVFLPTPLAEAALAADVFTQSWPEASKLRFLFTGGDRLRQHPVQALPFTLINNYGPTENCVITTFAVVPSGIETDVAPAIGRPVDNVQVYVLDAALQPVPVGARGELYIGGANLARGYLGAPGKTAERFIPDPFSVTPGVRLYRSGDVVRYRPDGTLDFIGRVDFQVKVRGYRIELGEIEAVLLQQAVVREVVVEAVDNGNGDKRLVAYVVVDGALDLVALRRELLTQLSDYMIPTQFVTLADLPLTPNGKVDRRALPTPDPLSALAENYLAPRNQVESDLVEIWQDVLGVARVGVQDDFFALGGHSLLATLVASRVTKAFAMTVSVREVFEAPTVAQLALRIEELRAENVAREDTMSFDLGRL